MKFRRRFASVLVVLLLSSFFVFLQFGVAPVHATGLALDGSVTAACLAGSTKILLNLTTSTSNDVIIAEISTRDHITGFSTVTSITSNPSITWTKRNNETELFVTNYWINQEEWYSTWSSHGSINLTVNVNFRSNQLCQGVAFGISGADTTTIFDSNAGANPIGNDGGTGGSKASVSVSTSNANDFILGGAVSGQSYLNGVGSGFTKIQSGPGSAGYYTEYKVVSSTQSNMVVNFSEAANDYWCMIADAVMQASVAGDTTKPTYSSPATNTTVRAMPCNFSVTLADETALANYTFGTNNTGTWTNDTIVSISGTSYKANVTKTLNSTVGVVVQWEYWFNDSSNNLNNTGIQSITTTLYAWTASSSVTLTNAITDNIGVSWHVTTSITLSDSASCLAKTQEKISPTETGTITLATSIQVGYHVASSEATSETLGTAVKVSEGIVTTETGTITLTTTVQAGYRVTTSETSSESLSTSSKVSEQIVSTETGTITLTTSVCVSYGVTMSATSHENLTISNPIQQQILPSETGTITLTTSVKVGYLVTSNEVSSIGLNIASPSQQAIVPTETGTITLTTSIKVGYHVASAAATSEVLSASMNGSEAIVELENGTLTLVTLVQVGYRVGSSEANSISLNLSIPSRQGNLLNETGTLTLSTIVQVSYHAAAAETPSVNMAIQSLGSYEIMPTTTETMTLNTVVQANIHVPTYIFTSTTIDITVNQTTSGEQDIILNTTETMTLNTVVQCKSYMTTTTAETTSLTYSQKTSYSITLATSENTALQPTGQVQCTVPASLPVSTSFQTAISRGVPILESLHLNLELDILANANLYLWWLNLIEFLGSAAVAIPTIRKVGKKIAARR